MSIDPGDKEVQSLRSEVRRLEQELHKARAELVQSVKLAGIGTIASGIAHELNTPLATMSLATELLQKRITTGPELSLLENLEKATHRCKTIVAALLRYARADQSATFTDLDLNRSIQDVCDLVEQQVQTTGITLERRLGHVPRTMGNANQIQQVFTNLIMNARDAIRQVRGAGTIIVRTAYDGEWIHAYVEDDGCGMDRQTMERIFEPFFTTKAAGEGTGLGLSVTERILKEHHAHVTVESRVGHGTTFWLKFPPVAAASGPSGPSGPPPPALTEQGS